MIKTVKKIISYIMVCVLFLSMCIPCEAAQTSTATASDANATTGFPQITSTSAIIMDAQSGQIIYEKNSHTRQYPASITKIMTLILIFDALDKGSLKMDDTVTTSAHAKSMGGSQVFLEEGEIQTVETLIKCIVIASGNDASVAMAVNRNLSAT